MDHQLQPPLPNVFFSQRRRTRQRTVHQAQRGGDLPDWVWGAGLGLIVLIFVGGFFLFSQCTGTSAACDTPLPTLGQNTVDANGFNQIDAQLGHIIDFLDQGDVNAAQTVLYQTGNVHNFVHSADGVIRTKDVNTGKDLCKTLIQFETDLETPAGQNTATLAREATQLRKDMQDGAVALGYPRPGTRRITWDNWTDA